VGRDGVAQRRQPLDVPGDGLQLRPVRERPDVGRLVERAAERAPRQLGGEQRRQPVVLAGVDVDPPRREAP
jgi:hypothetical protein